MKCVPATTFGRTAMFLSAILLAGMLAIFLLLRVYVVIPSINAQAQLLTSHLHMLHIYLSQGDQEKGREERLDFLERQGWLFLRGDAEAPLGRPTRLQYLRRLEEHVRSDLGLNVTMRMDSEDPTILWIDVEETDPLWIGVRVPPLTEAIPPILVFWLGGIAVLSLVGAAVAARHVNRPLRELAKAASVIGRGESPEEIATSGPREIRALAGAFNRMVADLARLARDRVLLLAGVSHDLRTPLTRMRLAAEMVDSLEPELARGMIQDVDDMEAVIAQFMAYIRPSRAEPTEVIDFNELVERVVRREVPPDVNVELHLVPIPPLRLEATAFRRLLANLLANAVQHGNRTPISVSTEVAGGSIVLRVMDGGPGVPDADTNRLFEPFVRGESARSGRGSGLGLSIAQRIAEIHGGRISLRNRSTGGTEAMLRLPIDRASSTDGSAC